MDKKTIIEQLQKQLADRRAVLTTYKGEMHRSGAHFVKGEIHALQWAIATIEAIKEE